MTSSPGPGPVRVRLLVTTHEDITIPRDKWDAMTPAERVRYLRWQLDDAPVGADTSWEMLSNDPDPDDER